MRELSEWYSVSFDDKCVYRDVRPPGEEVWTDQFEWKDIVRICFQSGDLYCSDDIYFFVNYREESYLIPIEAKGGYELWGEVIERGLFDAKLAIKIATEIQTDLHCCPEFTKEDIERFSKSNE